MLLLLLLLLLLLVHTRLCSPLLKEEQLLLLLGGCGHLRGLLSWHRSRGHPRSGLTGLGDHAVLLLLFEVGLNVGHEDLVVKVLLLGDVLPSAETSLSLQETSLLLLGGGKLGLSTLDLLVGDILGVELQGAARTGDHAGSGHARGYSTGDDVGLEEFFGGGVPEEHLDGGDLEPLALGLLLFAESAELGEDGLDVLRLRLGHHGFREMVDGLFFRHVAVLMEGVVGRELVELLVLLHEAGLLGGEGHLGLQGRVRHDGGGGDVLIHHVLHALLLLSLLLGPLVGLLLSLLLSLMLLLLLLGLLESHLAGEEELLLLLLGHLGVLAEEPLVAHELFGVGLLAHAGLLDLLHLAATGANVLFLPRILESAESVGRDMNMKTRGCNVM